jgi:hypothetical protein
MWTAARTRHDLLLADVLGDLAAVRAALPTEGTEHAWYKFYALAEFEAFAPVWTLDLILSEIT